MATPRQGIADHLGDVKDDVNAVGKPPPRLRRDAAKPQSNSVLFWYASILPKGISAIGRKEPVSGPASFRAAFLAQGSPSFRQG